MSNTNTLGTIFSQPWWLEAVASGEWDEITVKENGQTIARMPYVLKKKRKHTLCLMPPLTQTLGPTLVPYTGKYTNKLSHEKKVLTQLIEKLPSSGYFQQNFHYSITNWLPFYWQGYQQTTRYTYVLDDLTDVDVLWKGLRSNIRREIKKAKKKIAIRTDLSVDDFLDLNEMTFKRQNMNLPYSREFVHRLDNACGTQECRQMFFAEDGNGQLHAAIYIVWDDNSAYYLMGGSDPELRNSGATSLLMWEAIQFASTVTKSFDFEGSMIEPVERFFRAFGAKQKPYFQVTKIGSPLLKFKQDVRSWWGMLNHGKQ